MLTTIHHPIRFLLLATTVLAIACDDPDLHLKDPGELDAEDVEDDEEFSAPNAGFEFVDDTAVRPIDVSHGLDIDNISDLAPEPLAGYTSKNVCTSWHCTNVSISNVAGMPDGNTVWYGATASHNNNSVDFYWTRLEHVVCNYDNTTCWAVPSCQVNGDWSTSTGRACNQAAQGLNGWTIHSRLCMDIKDDGKGTLCTGYVIAKAVW